MSTYEISTCFSSGTAGSDLDAQAIAETIAAFVDQEKGTAAFNGGALFALQTDEVFFGTRRAHTNVRFTVRDTDYATAQRIRDAVATATNRYWNAPTQDMDERDLELGDASNLGMFTAEGARLLAAELDSTERMLRSGDLSPVRLEEHVEALYATIARAGHHEVTDTDVREGVWARIDRVLEELGLQLVRR